MKICQVLKTSRRIMKRSALLLAVLGLLQVTAQAATVTKSATGTDLADGASWGGTAPTNVDIAAWASTSLGSSLTLGTPATWLGISVAGALSAIDISGAGTLTIGTSGVDLSSATAVNLTIGSGLNLMGQQSWKAATGKTLNVAGTFTRTGAYVDFGNFNASAVLGTLGNTYNILGPWAYTGSGTTLKYATSASGLISAYTAATADAGNLASVTSATDNYKYSAAATLAGNKTGNTLQYTGGASTTALGAYSLTLNGLMNAGSGKLTITGTAGSSGLVTGANNELDIVSNNQNIDISAVISGTGALVYGGPSAATLTLSGINTYSGGTIINAGTLSAGTTSAAVFGTGNVTVQSGGTLYIPQNATFNFPMTLTLNGGTLSISFNGNTPTWAGPVILNANSIINNQSSGNGGAVSGNISGAGGFTKTGNDRLTLSGANTYSGPTIVSTGTLRLSKLASLYNGVESMWTSANITVATNAILYLNVGGSGEFTAAQAGLLYASLTTVTNNGLKAGALFGFDTANASPTTVTISSNLTDSVGTGGGMVVIRKYGVNTLELTGANTYSGKTIFENGSLKVSSFNYISSGTLSPNTSSSLGKPTTAVNGTIDIGDTWTASCTITYTGTGETTDRVLNLKGRGTYTLDQSGSGLLKFTSPMTFAPSNADPTLSLQGSTSGTGELSASIPDLSVTRKLLLAKSGTGTWTLSNGNTYTGVTTINGGTLVLGNTTALPGGIGVSGGLSALTFNGGVLGLGAGNFTRSLATAGTVTGVNFNTTAGGWAAYGADRIVNLGGASGSITWVTANTGLNGRILILGANTATHTVDFQNPLDMGAATRTVQTDNGSALIDGKMSGVLSNGNLSKAGLGTLALTATNTYAGTTAVTAGTLLVNGNNSGSGTITVSSGATLGGTGSIAGAATFSSGAKAVFTVTRDPVTEANSTPLTVTGVMTYNTTEVHVNLPANLPSGTYTLATSSATPTGSLTATPVVDSGSYAAGFTSATVSLDTANKRLLLTVNGLPTNPSQLAITSVNGGATPTVGVAFNVTVQAQDANGVARRVLADTAVTLSVTTGTGSLSGTVTGTILSGTSSVTISGVTYDTAESGVVLTATRTSGDSLTAGDSAAFTVLPDTTPVALDLTGFPSPQTAGVVGTVTVTAKTGSGGTATAYTGTVHFTSSAVSAGLPSDYTFAPGDAGVHLFTGVTLNTAGTQSITVTDTVTPSLTDTQAGIVVTPASAATLVVSGFPSPQGTGVNGSVTVTAKDAYGNTDTNYTGTIHFTSSDGSAGLPGDYTFTGGDLGTHTFINGVMLVTLGLQSITATDTVTGSITGTQSAITIWILPTVFSWTNTVSGVWSSAGNWTNNMGVYYAPAAAGQPDYTLRFNVGTYTATHDLSNGFLLNQLQFAGVVTIAGTSGLMLTNNGAVLPQIEQRSAGAVLVTMPLHFAAPVTVGGAGNGSMEFFGIISGAGSLVKTNAGDLKLTADNTYSGGTFLQNGSISFANTGNAYLGTGDFTAYPGTTLSLNGNGNLTNAFYLSDAKVSNGNSFQASINGPITLWGTNTFDLATTGNMTIGGNISGSGGLTKLGVGQGPLHLYATNTFTGTTTINAGTIQIGPAGQLASQMIVVNTGTLKLSNSSSLAESVTVTIADGGAKIDIPNGVTQTVKALYLGSDGKPELIGTWGHSTSDAVNKDDVHFTATSGKLRVLTGLQRGLIITVQ